MKKLARIVAIVLVTFSFSAILIAPIFAEQNGILTDKESLDSAKKLGKTFIHNWKKNTDKVVKSWRKTEAQQFCEFFADYDMSKIGSLEKIRSIIVITEQEQGFIYHNFNALFKDRLEGYKTSDYVDNVFAFFQVPSNALPLINDKYASHLFYKGMGKLEEKIKNAPEPK